MTDSLSAVGFSTPEMDEIFSPPSVVEHMLAFESALVLALADVGLAPSDAAEAIDEACRLPLTDANAILASTWSAGTPVIALVDAVKQRLSQEEHVSWVHYGATSQDVIDTAHMLLAKRAIAAMVGSLGVLAHRLRQLVEEHRDQPQIGRTFLQHASETTFGMRAASWLSPLIEHVVELRTLADSLPVSMGGPVGNLASYGAKGIEVVGSVARRLGLSTPVISWHTDRSVIRRLSTTVDAAVATLEKIATDVSFLAASDIGELSVRPGGSSSMSGKRNPIDAIRVLASATICHGAVEMITRARPHELDRALGSWHVEWAAIPMMFRTAGAAVEAATTMFDALEVNVETMADRVGSEGTRHLGGIDARQIDGVLSRFDEVLGSGSAAAG